MATRRTTIEIVVVGLADLQAANRELTKHIEIVERLTGAYGRLTGAMPAVAIGLGTINNSFNRTNTTINTTIITVNNFSSSLTRAGTSSAGFLESMLKYRAVSLVFNEVQKAISAVTSAMNDLQTQQARIARVTGAIGRPLARASMIETAVRTGSTDIASLGEGYYQLSITLKDLDQRADAYRATMALVTAEESDARETARNLVSIHAQFREELDRTVPAAQQFGRVGEMVAILWKNGNLELSEYIQTAKYLNPVLKGVGAEMAQSFAIAQAFSELGARGRQIGTGFGGLIQSVWGKTNKINDKLQASGFQPIEIFKNPEGGFDAVKTLDKIVQYMSRLSPQARAVYAEIVGGSRAAVRSLELLDVEATNKMLHSLEEFKRAQEGKTAELDRQMRERMDTFQGQFQRSWNSIILAIGAGLDDLSRNTGLLKILKQFADIQEQWGNQRERQSTYAEQMDTALTGSGRNALHANIATLQKALVNREDHDRQNPLQRVDQELFSYQNTFRTFTQGMTPGQTAMIRHRFFTHPAATVSETIAQMKQVQAQMERDLASAAIPTPVNPISPGLGVQATPDALLAHLKSLDEKQKQNALVIAAAARKYGLDPLAMISVAKAESGLDAANKNPDSTATGLFQLLAGTAPGINRSDARANAEFAAREVARLGGSGLTGKRAIDFIVEQFERPGPAGTRYDEREALKFYKGHGGFARDLTADETAVEREAEKEARIRQQTLDKKAAAAQIELDHAKKEYGETSPLVLPFIQRADAAHKLAVAGDPNELLKLKYGLSGNMAAYQDDLKKSREGADEKRKEAARLHAQATDFYAEIAPSKYGLFSEISEKRAREAQDAAIEAAKADGDIILSWKLIAGTEGPLKKHTDARIAEAIRVQDEAEKTQEETLRQREEIQSRFVQELIGGGERRLRGIQRGARPNNVFGDAQSDERGRLQNTVSTIDQIIKRLQAVPDKTDQTNKELETMRERLADANAALVDFNDRLEAQAYQRRIKAEEDAYQLRAEDITHLHKLRFAKDDEGAYRNKVAELSELLANSQQHVENVARLNTGVADASDKVRDAAKQRDLAQQNLTDYQIDAKIQRYLNVYSNVKGTVHESLQAFFHGQGDLGTVAQNIGGSIVDAALDAQIKRFADPLISTVTSEILAIQGNTDALQILTSAMTGGGLGGGTASSPFAQSVAAGVEQGMQDFGWGPVGDGSGAKGGKGKPGARGSGPSDLQKGIGAGLAAYSIGANAANQGVNVGNVLGAGLAGFALGGPLGAGIGVAVDLIGGLFHQNKKPTDTPQNLNPALYNAPSGFDLGAYNYSAYGKLPTLQNVGFEVKPITPPIFNIYVDGAKVAAQIEINRQATSVNVTLGNTVRDRYSPV